MKKLISFILLASTLLFAAPGTHTVALNWTASTSTGVTDYNVYRATTSGGEGATPYATGITGTTFTDPTVTNGVTYYYTVTAVSPGGESVPSAEASVLIPMPPNAPTGLQLQVH
jgi:fibronectin type 3 domain-containing protein